MKNKILALGFISALISCAPAIHRGVVAMKIDDTSAHVCVDNNEVKPGDSITLFRNICEQKKVQHPWRRANTLCQKKEIGKGTITELLNEHYATAEFSSSVAFEEGDMVEKR